MVRNEDFEKAIAGEPCVVSGETTQKGLEQGEINRNPLNSKDSLFPSIPCDSGIVQPSQCTEMDRGRIELPTPGFSVLLRRCLKFPSYNELQTYHLSMQWVRTSIPFGTYE